MSSERVWACRGWPEYLVDEGAAKDAPHQWMHAYYEVPEGAACSVCRATEDDPDRWDGTSDPFVRPLSIPEEDPDE